MVNFTCRPDWATGACALSGALPWACECVRVGSAFDSGDRIKQTAHPKVVGLVRSGEGPPSPRKLTQPQEERALGTCFFSTYSPSGLRPHREGQAFLRLRTWLHGGAAWWWGPGTPKLSCGMEPGFPVMNAVRMGVWRPPSGPGSEDQREAKCLGPPFGLRHLPATLERTDELSGRALTLSGLSGHPSQAPAWLCSGRRAGFLQSKGVTQVAPRSPAGTGPRRPAYLATPGEQ